MDTQNKDKSFFLENYQNKLSRYSSKLAQYRVEFPDAQRYEIKKEYLVLSQKLNDDMQNSSMLKRLSRIPSRLNKILEASLNLAATPTKSLYYSDTSLEIDDGLSYATLKSKYNTYTSPFYAQYFTEQKYGELVTFLQFPDISIINISNQIVEKQISTVLGFLWNNNGTQQKIRKIIFNAMFNPNTIVFTYINKKNHLPSYEILDLRDCYPDSSSPTLAQSIYFIHEQKIYYKSVLHDGFINSYFDKKKIEAIIAICMANKTFETEVLFKEYDSQYKLFEEKIKTSWYSSSAESAQKQATLYTETITPIEKRIEDYISDLQTIRITRYFTKTIDNRVRCQLFLNHYFVEEIILDIDTLPFVNFYYNKNGNDFYGQGLFEALLPPQQRYETLDAQMKIYTNTSTGPTYGLPSDMHVNIGELEQKLLAVGPAVFSFQSEKGQSSAIRDISENLIASKILPLQQLMDNCVMMMANLAGVTIDDSIKATSSGSQFVNAKNLASSKDNKFLSYLQESLSDLILLIVKWYVFEDKEFQQFIFNNFESMNKLLESKEEGDVDATFKENVITLEIPQDTSAEITLNSYSEAERRLTLLTIFKTVEQNPSVQKEISMTAILKGFGFPNSEIALMSNIFAKNKKQNQEDEQVAKKQELLSVLEPKLKALEQQFNAQKDKNEIDNKKLKLDMVKTLGNIYADIKDIQLSKEELESDNKKAATDAYIKSQQMYLDNVIKEEELTQKKEELAHNKKVLKKTKAN